jgi:hypothetical protein
VFLHIASDLISAVAVKHPEQAEVWVALQGQEGEFGVLHVLAPALHLAAREPQVLVGGCAGLFFGDWFV